MAQLYLRLKIQIMMIAKNGKVLHTLYNLKMLNVEKLIAI